MLEDDDGYGPLDDDGPEKVPEELTAQNFKGFVYMAATQSAPHEVKIGHSKDPYERFKPMNAAHPENYEVYVAFATSEPKRAETVCHAALRDYRLRPRKELFGISTRPSGAPWVCSDTGQEIEDLTTPADEASRVMADALTREGIVFEEIYASSLK